MKKNKILPSLRIDSELYEKILKALKINQQGYLEVSLAQFRRMALRHFSERVLAEGLDISIKPK